MLPVICHLLVEKQCNQRSYKKALFEAQFWNENYFQK